MLGKDWLSGHRVKETNILNGYLALGKVHRGGYVKNVVMAVGGGRREAGEGNKALRYSVYSR